MSGILPKGIGRRENSACRYCKSGTSWTRRRSRWIERVANWYRMCLPMEPSSHIIFWWISFGRVESGSSESAYRIATSPKVHYRIALDWLRHFHEHTKKRAKKKKKFRAFTQITAHRWLQVSFDRSFSNFANTAASHLVSSRRQPISYNWMGSGSLVRKDYRRNNNENSEWVVPSFSYIGQTFWGISQFVNLHSNDS